MPKSIPSLPPIIFIWNLVSLHLFQIGREALQKIPPSEIRDAGLQKLGGGEAPNILEIHNLMDSGIGEVPFLRVGVTRVGAKGDPIGWTMC